MSKDTVTIGCKLPAGLKLEIGLQTTVPDSATKRPIVQVKQLPTYECVRIRGWNAHTLDMRRQLDKTKSAAGVPHGMNTTPFLNRGISKAFWDQWKAEHPNSWLIKNQILFEVADGDHASAALRVEESAKTPTVFEPLDPEKTIVPGVTARTLEEA